MMLVIEMTCNGAPRARSIVGGRVLSFTLSAPEHPGTPPSGIGQPYNKGQSILAPTYHRVLPTIICYLLRSSVSSEGMKQNEDSSRSSLPLWRSMICLPFMHPDNTFVGRAYKNETYCLVKLRHADN